MKLKNLCLLTAVIGCGLFATILKASKHGHLDYVEQKQEQQVIFVPAKDLLVGTKLEKEKLAELIRKKRVNKADVPPNAILNEDELIGKTVMQNLKSDDCFLVSNVGRVIACFAANGKHLLTLKLPYAHVGPWVQAGKKVDIVHSHRPPGLSVVRHVQLLQKIHVLAVDYSDKPETNSTDKPIICTVTLEASFEELQWLQLAQDAGASLRLLVRNDSDKGGCPRLSDAELQELFKGASKEKQDRQDHEK